MKCLSSIPISEYQGSETGTQSKMKSSSNIGAIQLSKELPFSFFGSYATFVEVNVHHFLYKIFCTETNFYTSLSTHQEISLNWPKSGFCIMEYGFYPEVFRIF